MSCQLRPGSLVSCLAVVAAVVTTGSLQIASAGHRGHRHHHQRHAVPCEPCQADPCAPSAAPVEMLPETTAPPQSDQQMTDPTVDSPLPPSAIPAPLDTDFAPSFDPGAGLATSFGAGGAGALAYAAPGYIDPAQIRTRVRVRYDNMQGTLSGQRERAGYMYPTPGNLGGYGGGRTADYFNIPNDLDVEEMYVYVELALRDRFSIFIDLPFRWLTLPDNALAGGGGPQRGVYDISAGFRWGWIDCPDEHLTLQVRTRVPTGEFDRLLGTGNTSIDIGLLYDQQLGERTRFYAELNDWQTLDAAQLTPGTVTDPSLLNLDANVLRYGIGLGYDVLRCGSRCQPKAVTALFEVVGWTVLDGNTPVGNDIIDAEGDTIVNGKYGIRYRHDCHSIYVGYGHNWTNDLWYEDLFRFEWQRVF